MTSAGVRRQRASGRLRRAPRPEHGASMRIRSNVPARQGGCVPSAVITPRRPPGTVRVLRDTSPARWCCSSEARSLAPRSRARAASSADFPPGPAHRSSQRSSRPPNGAWASAMATSCEPSSWTPARPSATAWDGSGVARIQGDGVGREPSGVPARLLKLLDRGACGASHQHHLRRRVVGHEQGVEIAAGSQRVAQAADHPARMGVGHRREPDRVGGRVGCDPADPAVEIVRGHLAKHRVGETGRALADLLPDQIHGGADRGVRRHPHREQLVRPEAQRIEHLGLQLRPVETGGDDGVVGALATEGSRHQLSGERGVTTRQLVLAKHMGQHEVGIGVVETHRPQDVVRRGPGRVAPPPHRRPTSRTAPAGPRISHRRSIA